MNHSDSAPPIHTHVFDSGNQAGERGTRLVMVITALMMVVTASIRLVDGGRGFLPLLSFVVLEFP